MLAIAKIKMILAKITPPPSSPWSTGSIIRLGREAASESKIFTGGFMVSGMGEILLLYIGSNIPPLFMRGRGGN